MSTPHLEKSESAAGVGIRELLRYGYAGSLLGLLIATNFPAVAANVKELGPVVGALIVFAAGAALHVGYKGSIGRFVLFPLFQVIHRGWKGSEDCRDEHLKSKFYVKEGWKAWELIRSSAIVDAAESSRLYRQHSENHSGYQTALIMVSGGIIQAWNGQCAWSVWLLIGGIVLIGATFVADIDLCGRECVYLKTLNEGEVRRLLQAGGLVGAEPQGAGVGANATSTVQTNKPPDAEFAGAPAPDQLGHS